jgi:ADP-heptose:LPS heptosyltransferase
MSLPRLFETELVSVPQAVPYLHADPEQTGLWRQRLEGDGYKVGLVWAGYPGHRQDRLRSMSLTALAPLAKMQGVSFYSLQKGPAAAEAATPPAGMRLIDLAPELDDFATTAAVIANLDLVITVDTAVAHLAGAMGKPVWTLIYSPPDWRWLLDRDDSPWYPTMRLFRQGVTGEWGAVIEQVVAELQQAASAT